VRAAWIVVRSEKHLDDKFWICVDRADALAIAEDVIAYWRQQYTHGAIDETCYENQIRHVDAEDGFRVYVVPVNVREPGERAATEGQ
jgi:hypothetical protein